MISKALNVKFNNIDLILYSSNSVLLRQNPHNVAEWLTRVELYEGKPHEQIATFTEAVQTVDPTLATGKLNSLWVAFAKFYDNHDQIDDARIIFEKAIGVGFKQVRGN